MTESGSKIPDFHTSVIRGSAEELDKLCDPCQDDGHRVEARGLCVDCQEYLCSNCFSCHRKTKASKDHVLLENDEMDKGIVTVKAPDCSTEICSAHKNEVIKFFCPKHDALGCHDCIVLDHRTCDVDYIPEKYEHIGDSDGCRQMVKKLEEQIRETETVIKTVEDKDKELDKFHATTSDDIATLREDINARIDCLQFVADSKRTSGKQAIQYLLTKCTNLSSNLKDLKISIENSEMKQQNGRVFVALKRAERKLNVKELQKFEKCLQGTSTRFALKRNKELQNKAWEQNIFGEIADVQNPIHTYSLIYREDVGVRTGTDTEICGITACKLLSPNHKVVLADYRNLKLKIIDRCRRVVNEEIKLDSNPFDIAVIPEDKIAVTLPNKNEVIVLTTAGPLSIIRTIKVTGVCRGIIYHQGCMYVLCLKVNSIIVLDMQGKVQNTIPLPHNDTFKTPNCIVSDENFQFFYISCYDSGVVARVTTNGDNFSLYTDRNFIKPYGMAMLDDGSLMVCTYSKTVQHLSKDLKEGLKVTDLPHMPYSICHDSERNVIYIGSWDCDKMKVFNLQCSVDCTT